jgi:tetratricopeptide (TPR) repeat protein
MENKRSILTIAALLSYIVCAATTNLLGEATPSSVQTFYSCMQRLSRTTDKNLSHDISKQMKECFYGSEQSVSGIEVPNDFRFFDYDRKNISHNDRNLNVLSYVDRLWTYIFQDKVMTLSYRIIKSEISGEQPDYARGRLTMQATIMDTYVEKTYTIRGVQRTYNDTVRTDYASGKINEIRNGYGLGVINITTLRNRASIAYRRGNYAEAYKIYEQIIAQAPNDADALFRIGLMTYFQYKDCGIAKKSRKDRAISYLERCQRASSRSGVGERAHNALFHIQNPNI